MRRCISKSSGHLVDLVILPIALALPSTAVAQEFDLGPIPPVEIECFAESEAAGNLAPDSSIDGSWLQFRRDRKLTGRSPLIGNITCPEVLWSIDLGARKTWLSIRPGSGASQINLPVSVEFGDAPSKIRQFEADPEGLLLDLDGDLTLRVDPDGPDRKIGDFLPTMPGFEQVGCFAEPSPALGNDDPLPCFLENRQNGEWVRLWESEPLGGFTLNQTTSEGGRNIVGDFDADGELEMAAVGWAAVYVFDLATGDLEQTGVFWVPEDLPASPRGYGWFGAFNLDDDPKHEFIIVGTREKFISVLGWQNNQLVELWDHEIEADIRLGKTLHHAGVAPVQDVDGDGHPEIVTSIYNEMDDQNWHTIVFDGVTGAIKFDLPSTYLSGLNDVDGNGVAELFVSQTTAQAIPKYGDIKILSFDGGTESTIWSASSSGFPLLPIPRFPDNVNVGNGRYKHSMFFRDGWTAGLPIFITRQGAQNSAEVTLRVHQWDGSSISEIASLSGTRLQVMSLPSTDPSLGMLIRSIAESAEESIIESTNTTTNLEVSGHIRSNHLDGSQAAGYGFLTSSVVAPLAPGALPTVITQDYEEFMRAYRLSPGSSSPIELWRVPGRGMINSDFTTATTGFASVLIADALGTGELAVMVADRASDGRARIKAIDSIGRTSWQTSFAVPGEPAPTGFDPGLLHWVAGHFTSTGHEDVLVGFRTGADNNDTNVLNLLDGRDGSLIWQRSFGGAGGCGSEPTSAGGLHMPAFDWDGDGLDDVLQTRNGTFTVFEGATGDILINRISNGGACDPPEPSLFDFGPGQHPIASVADFLNNGTEQILWGKNGGTMAILDFNGEPFWRTPEHEGMPEFSLQGVGDMDGDGDLDIFVVGFCGANPGNEIQVYDAATGTLRWSLAMPESCEGPPPEVVAMGDLDGDGKDEAFVTIATTLWAFGETSSGQGQILWRATFAIEAVHYPVIADVDGTGRPQLLINHSDGYLYGLGKLFVDTDGDGVDDSEDAFPNDPNEWEDTDGDGIGNNADTDDDDDTMPDDYEIANGLDPLDAADAITDADGDGFTNLEEFQEGTNPQNPRDYPGVRRAPAAIFILLGEDEE